MGTDRSESDPTCDSSSLDAFERERDRLFGLAYRMTSSASEAEDIVQEAWVRFDGATYEVREPAAFLTTIVTRLAIDRLRSAQARRERYVGPWLPEPILTDRDDPARIVEIDESIRLGFLHVLDRLGPVDRAVFLLHDVFAVPFADVADTVDRSESTCRQIAKRARERIRAERPAVAADAVGRRELLDAFLAALFTGDPKELEKKLADDVIVLSDGGADVRAARNPVVGPHRVARLLTNLTKRIPEDASLEIVEANGELAAALVMDGVPIAVHEVEFRDGLLHRLHSVNNPDKLEAVRRVW